MIRMRTVSVLPPANPETSPTSPPITAETMAAANPTMSEILEPQEPHHVRSAAVEAQEVRAARRLEDLADLRLGVVDEHRAEDRYEHEQPDDRDADDRLGFDRIAERRNPGVADSTVSGAWAALAAALMTRSSDRA